MDKWKVLLLNKLHDGILELFQGLLNLYTNILIHLLITTFLEKIDFIINSFK